jgi:molybdopterin molybdotransferase
MTPPQSFHDVRMKGFRDRTEVADVLHLLDQRVVPLPGEPVVLSAAAGRVLAAPVVSPVDVPGFRRAAMDGFAVRGADTFGAEASNPLALTIVGLAMPASPFSGTVTSGQVVRIMTGAPVPDGADAVLVAESAELEPGGRRVFAREAVPPGRNIGRVGEDVAKGSAILAAGRRLRPQDVGLLASIGVGEVMVVRRPRIVILVTGNELLPPGSRPEGYRIVDSNSTMLAALIARDGGDCSPVRYLRDDFVVVRDALRAADADVIMISGGSSVGAEDHAPRALAELGELAVHGVALRPAAPSGIGFMRGRSVFLLPGNPVSCLCAYDLFAGRAIRRLGGRSGDLPYRRVSVPLASKIVSAVGRVDYARVRIEHGQASPIAVSGASILSTTVVADGFVLVERDREGHAPGEVVEVWLYDG